MRNILLFLFLSIKLFLRAQHSITICQECIEQEVGLANVEILKTEKVNTQCKKYYIKSPEFPFRTALFTDTINFDIFLFWIEPEIKNIKLWASHCREKEIWMVKPTALNKLERSNFLFSKYAETLYDEKNPNYSDSIYIDYLTENILQNKHSPLSLFNIEIVLHRGTDKGRFYLIDSLDSSLKNNPEYKRLKAFTENQKYKRIVKKGDTVSFYDMKGLDDHIFKPSNKGKLLFNWSSTCGPCKRVIPSALELMKKYKNVEVIFWSLDTEYEQWKQSVNKHKIPLDNNISDLMGASGKMYTSLNIYALPSFVLLQSDNTFIMKAEGANEFELIEREVRRLMEAE